MNSIRFSPYLSSFLCILTVLLLSLSAARSEERATVLIVMEPFKAVGKTWDIGKGADPVLCMKAGCYVGRGFGVPAKFFKGKRAYLPAVRARACANSLKCVYRDVGLKEGRTQVWPVDLDGFKRDYMPTRSVAIDRSCLVTDGRLECLHGVFTAQYSMWVVPEKVAKSAGKKALDYALYKGISDARKDYMTDFLGKQREELPQTVSRLYSLLLDDEIPLKCAGKPDVISEAFFITGVLKGDRRRDQLALDHTLFNDGDDPYSRSLMTAPEKFWQFHDAVFQLSGFAFAQKRQEFSYQKGVIFRNNGKTTSLLVGWDAKSRARRVIDQCISNLSFARKGQASLTQ